MSGLKKRKPQAGDLTVDSLGQAARWQWPNPYRIILSQWTYGRPIGRATIAGPTLSAFWKASFFDDKPTRGYIGLIASSPIGKTRGIVAKPAREKVA
jgi:hypothetical protein